MVMRVPRLGAAVTVAERVAIAPEENVMMAAAVSSTSITSLRTNAPALALTSTGSPMNHCSRSM
jgi:hypothetical protein